VAVLNRLKDFAGISDTKAIGASNDMRRQGSGIRRSQVRTYSIAAIPGDGIGKEVVAAGMEVLLACAERDGRFTLDITRFDWGSERYKKMGTLMPADGIEALKQFDAILFGAVGASDVPDDVTLWGLRLAICQSLDQYANIRPARVLNGIQSPLRAVRPQDIDWVIIRENSEGEYSGQGGRSHRGFAEEVATEVAIFTRAGVQRIMRFAFEMARSRPRKLLTVVTKSNAQRFGLVLWDEVAREVARDYSDVRWDRMLVDAMTVRMVLHPATLDTIVATNLHADILSDLAAALTGSIGLAPTANLNPERRFPSMFEPIHGSALDIVGKGIANPLGTFWSAAMMLEHLGETTASRQLMTAIERVTADRSLHTPDLGGGATTRKVTDALLEFVRQQNARD
jgi:tartrate dehydrogenase/decarboxylase / D-malate dehydrogenase